MTDRALPDLVSRLRLDTSGIDRAVGETKSKFAGFSSAIKPIAAAAGAAIVTHFGKASIDAFKESEAAQARLADAFRKFPALADTNIGAFQKLNEQLAKKTKFDDDATASGQAVLAQFGLTGKQIADLTPLLQDYAAKTGKDLPGAAQDLGKAVLGQGRALKAVGLELGDTGTKAGNLDQLMGGLRKQVGGFATAEGQTAAGKAQILANQFGELQEKVGAALVPALQRLADVLLRVVEFFGNLPGPVQAAIGIVAGLVVAVLAISKAVQAWTTIQAALNTVLALNPVVLIVAALAALVAGVVLAYQRSETFRDVVQSAWDVLKGVADFIAGAVVGAFNGMRSAVEAVVGFISRNWPLLLAILTGPIGLAVKFIIDHFDSIVSFVKGLPGRIASAASGMFDGIKNAFRSAINFIIRGWNSLEFKIPGFDPPGPGPSFGGFTLGLPNIPQLAEGAIVKARRGGTLAVLGEGRSDEAVTPLDRLPAIMAGALAQAGGTVGTIHVHVDLDGREIAHTIVEPMADAMRWRDAGLS